MRKSQNLQGSVEAVNICSCMEVRVEYIWKMNVSSCAELRGYCLLSDHAWKENDDSMRALQTM